MSAGEENILSKKRRLSVEIDDHNLMDSFPGTPMSIGSESSATNKIKLKIKVNTIVLIILPRFLEMNLEQIFIDSSLYKEI